MGCNTSRSPRPLEPVAVNVPPVKVKSPKEIDYNREDSLHSNATETSAITRAKSWVKDDMGFKAHLAKINDMSDLEKKFVMGNLLGEGITGEVKLCRSKVDNGLYAMKQLNTSRMDEAQIAELKAEIETLKRLDHPNIINLMEVFENDVNICIIMEHCSGGDLSQRRFDTENDVCSVVFQLAEAVAHCHHLGIVHRDLKMENIMFVSKDSDSIRLIDFGLSKKFLSREDIIANDKLLAQTDKNRIMKTACGTAFYMAPEMLTMSYSEKADIWALGVICFMLITGKPPFEGKDENTVFERVRRGRVVYNEKVWARLSPEALEFTKALLTFDPAKRPSAREMLDMPWLAKYQRRRKAIMEGKEGKLLGKEVCDSLIRFASYPPLKRAALMVVSHHVKEQDTRDLRNMFLMMDEDHSGELTFDEMYAMICKFSGAPVSEEYFHNVFAQMDQENTGKVHYMEFLAATLESRVKITGQLLNQAFDHLDMESTGAISIDNMHELLGHNFSREDVENLIKKGVHHCDCGEHDAVVTRADFIQMMGDAQLPSPSPTPGVPDTPTPGPADTSSVINNNNNAASHPSSPATVSRSETPSTISAVDSPGVEHVQQPPVIAAAVIAATTSTPTTPIIAPVALRSMRAPPLLPALSEEVEPDSRVGTPEIMSDLKKLDPLEDNKQIKV